MSGLEWDLEAVVRTRREEYTTADHWAGVGAVLLIWAEMSNLSVLGGSAPVYGPFGLNIPSASLPQLALNLADQYPRMTTTQRKGVRSLFAFLRDQADWTDLFAAGRELFAVAASPPAPFHDLPVRQAS